ncbi:MAG: hypothetical protein ACTSQE_12400 [Candidatus Heimdallarchaeaceae archaeon]
MKQEKELTLEKTYPKLYKHGCCLECGPGWLDLIKELSFKIEKIIGNMNSPLDEMPYATQIKEKYGTLRFYMSTETEEMSKLIEAAEDVSAKICEGCGAPGAVKNESGWYTCLCDNCEKDKH